MHGSLSTAGLRVGHYSGFSSSHSSSSVHRFEFILLKFFIVGVLPTATRSSTDCCHTFRLWTTSLHHRRALEYQAVLRPRPSTEWLSSGNDRRCLAKTIERQAERWISGTYSYHWIIRRTSAREVRILEWTISCQSTTHCTCARNAKHRTELETSSTGLWIISSTVEFNIARNRRTRRRICR